MRIRWREFELPNRVSIEKETHTDTYGKFVAEPFERGYGITIGNALRRILLSSIEGAAVTSIKVAGAQHELSTIPGVAEDIVQIVLNVKKLILRSYSKEPKTIYLKAEKKGEIAAADITVDETIEILNQDLFIAT